MHWQMASPSHSRRPISWIRMKPSFADGGHLEYRQKKKKRIMQAGSELPRQFVTCRGSFVFQVKFKTDRYRFKSGRLNLIESPPKFIGGKARRGLTWFYKEGII